MTDETEKLWLVDRFFEDHPSKWRVAHATKRLPSGAYRDDRGSLRKSDRHIKGWYATQDEAIAARARAAAAYDATAARITELEAELRLLKSLRTDAIAAALS